jgi:hypothetical protein
VTGQATLGLTTDLAWKRTVRESRSGFAGLKDQFRRVIVAIEQPAAGTKKTNPAVIPGSPIFPSYRNTPANFDSPAWVR